VRGGPASAGELERFRLSRTAEWAIVSAALLGVAALVFASYVRTGGLYYDDWSALATQRYPWHSGAFGGVRDFISGGAFVSRPGMAVLLAITNATLGADGSAHLVLAVLLAVVMAVVFVAFLRAVGVGALHATAMAALVLVFPWSDSTRLWSTVSLNNIAITLFLLGALAALHGLQRSGQAGWAWHAAAVACYGLSVLVHELAAGLVLVTGLLYLTRAAPAVAARRWAVDVAVVAAAVLVLRDSGTRTITGVKDSLEHARTIVDEGATLLATAMTPFGSAPRSLMGTLLIAILVAGGVVWLIGRRRSWGGDEGKWLLVSLGGVLVVGFAYLPYLSAGSWYVPLNPGQGNRINALAALGYVATIYGAAALAATLLRRLLPQRAAVLPALLLCAYALAIAGAWVDRLDAKAQWGRSAEIQDAVLASLHDAVPRPSDGTTFYVYGFPSTNGPGVPVFLWITDLSGAVRVTYADRSLTGFPMLEGTQLVCGNESMHPRGSGYTEAQTTRYGLTVLVDVSSGRTATIRDRRDCERRAGEFVPGPGRFASG
jgi:MFS family permease